MEAQRDLAYIRTTQLHLTTPTKGRVDVNQGRGPRVGHVLLAAATAGVIACVIGNAAGHKGGCSAEGKTTKGMECVDKKEKK